MIARDELWSCARAINDANFHAQVALLKLYETITFLEPVPPSIYTEVQSTLAALQLATSKANTAIESYRTHTDGAGRREPCIGTK